MYFGTNSVEGVYSGSAEAEKIYLGTTVVYEKASSTDPDTTTVDGTSVLNISEVGLTTGIVSANTSKVYSVADLSNNPDAIGLTTGVIGATVEDLSL